MTHIRNLKHDTNELLYKSETDSQTERADWGCQGGRGWGGLEWEIGVSRGMLLHIEWVNQDLLHSTGNYIQYPMIEHSGEEYFKKGIP